MTAQAPATGCAVKPVIDIKPKRVSVNGVVIQRADIARETQNHAASKPIEAWTAATRALVIRELLLQRARWLGLKPSPLIDAEGRRELDEEALIRQLVETEVQTPRADEAEIRRYYERNRMRFRSPPLYEARHILLPAAPGDVAARREARVQAGVLIARIAREPASFAALAKTESACPSAQTGGNLGQVGPDQTVPEFAAALATCPVGTVADAPIESRYGLHVVRVERRIEGADLPFDLVRDRIAAWMEEKVRRAAIRQYIGILAGRADIVGVDFTGASGPLVQ